eukprot:3541853-Pyramimonas_sp.AAC.1
MEGVFFQNAAFAFLWHPGSGRRGERGVSPEGSSPLLIPQSENEDGKSTTHGGRVVFKMWLSPQCRAHPCYTSETAARMAG